MNKRTWHYVQNPKIYEMNCDKCNGQNIEWSEYESMIWCYDCQIDTEGFGGIFSGLIGWGVCELLGISFDRYYIEENCIKYPKIVGNKIEYFEYDKKEN